MLKQLAHFANTHRGASLIVALYLIVGVIYSVVNPIHEATDELRHFRYVRYIADLGQLPVQSDDQGNAQAHHPPLYYALTAALTFWAHPDDPLYEPAHNPQWSFRNWEVGTDNKNQYLHGPDEAWPYRKASLAAHLARWVTLLWGAGTVALTYVAARVAFPDHPPVHLASAALVAFNPMFLYLGAAVNNDVPAGLIGAAILTFSLLIVRAGLTGRRIVMLGVVYALGLLVKFNLLAMLGLIELALIFALLRGKETRNWKGLLRANLIIVALSLLIAGWWYIRNTVLYGEPTGFLRLTEIWGVRDPHSGVALALRELGYAWTSLWARFGYGQIPIPDGYYVGLAILCGAGLSGAIVATVRDRQGNPDSDGRMRQSQMLALLVTSILINFAVLFTYITVSPAGAMGRFFFPGLSAFAILVAYGLTGSLPAKWDGAVSMAVGTALLAFALVCVSGYIAPAYAIPRAVAAPSDPLDIQIGDAARILAYEVAVPDDLQPGSQVDVTITWEILRPTDEPYTVFVHLLNPDGAMIAQRDTYTGLGNYPSTYWRPGHIFTETYRVFLPETLYRPDDAIVYVGLYHPVHGRLPVSGSTGGAEENAVALDQFSISAADSAYPNPVFVNWDNRFALVGWDIVRRVMPPGKRVRLTLYWQALDPSRDEVYKVFVHARDGWANIAGIETDPVISFPSTQWETDQIYESYVEFRFPADVTPGFYLIEVGWFSDVTGQRLNIIAPDGHIIDSWLHLTDIRVIAE